VVGSGVEAPSAFRLRYEPERRSDHIGFRVAAVRKLPRATIGKISE